MSDDISASDGTAPHHVPVTNNPKPSTFLASDLHAMMDKVDQQEMNVMDMLDEAVRSNLSDIRKYLSFLATLKDSTPGDEPTIWTERLSEQAEEYQKRNSQISKLSSGVVELLRHEQRLRKSLLEGAIGKLLETDVREEAVRDHMRIISAFEEGLNESKGKKLVEALSLEPGLSGGEVLDEDIAKD